MSEKGKVLYMKREGVFFNGHSRDQIRDAIKRGGVEDDTQADNVVEQIEQVICTSMVMAAKNVGLRLAEKAFKAFTQKGNTP